MGADSVAIDGVALPSLMTFRHSKISESFHCSLSLDPETVSEALAWHRGVLEHHTGMLRKYTHAAMFATDLVSILPRVQNRTALLLDALDLGDDLRQHVPNRCLIGSRFYFPLATWLMIYFIRT